MIRFLTNDLIDKVQWDNCISQTINGNLYAYAWYLDIVSPAWCALVEDNYEMVFPLTVSSRAGLNYVMQPYFTQQLGLFYRSLPSENKLLQFIDSIPQRYRFIDINLNSSNKIPAAVNVTQMTNLELDLINDYEKLASGYQTNLQRNLKKASQNKLTLAKHIRPEDIISLFRANKGQYLKHLGVDQYAIVQRIAYESMYRGIGEIWGAYNEFNQLVAGILWITSHQKSIFLFSALSEAGKISNAMPWLIDWFIRENSGKPLTLDFEGSNNEGLERFYSSFGAQKIFYQRFISNKLPFPYRMALKIWRNIRLGIKNI